MITAEAMLDRCLDLLLARSRTLAERRDAKATSLAENGFTEEGGMALQRLISRQQEAAFCVAILLNGKSSEEISYPHLIQSHGEGT